MSPKAAERVSSMLAKRDIIGLEVRLTFQTPVLRGRYFASFDARCLRPTFMTYCTSLRMIPHDATRPYGRHAGPACRPFRSDGLHPADMTINDVQSKSQAYITGILSRSSQERSIRASYRLFTFLSCSAVLVHSEELADSVSAQARQHGALYMPVAGEELMPYERDLTHNRSAACRRACPLPA